MITVIVQVGIMGLVILLGLLCVKIKFITAEGKRCLSLITLNVANPATIIVSFQLEYNEERLGGFLLMALLALITFVASAVLVPLIVRKGKGGSDERLPVERFAAIYSNCGFMGIPLINGVFGADGVFYLAAYVMLFNLCVWTHGVVVMQGKFSPKSVVGALKSPSVIAVIVGFFIFIFQIPLPDFLNTTIGSLAGLTTPLAMLVSGAMIAESDLLKIFKKPRIFYVSAIKLLFLPIIFMLALKPFGLDPLLYKVLIAAVACPTATITTIFAFNYKKDYTYAAEIFAVATILSMVTLPLVLWLTELIAGF